MRPIVLNGGKANPRDFAELVNRARDAFVKHGIKRSNVLAYTINQSRIWRLIV